MICLQSISSMGMYANINIWNNVVCIFRNTTQSVKIDQTNMSKLFLSDYKRRCYGAEDDSESTEMAS